MKKSNKTWQLRLKILPSAKNRCRFIRFFYFLLIQLPFYLVWAPFFLIISFIIFLFRGPNIDYDFYYNIPRDV